MKKKILLMLSMIAFVVCLLAISVSAVEVDGIYYSIETKNGESYAVVNTENRTKCTLENVVIPATVTVGEGEDKVEYKVTAISNDAFGSTSGSTSNNKSIKTLCIGANVSSVGQHAFRNLANLTTVTIANTEATTGINFHNAQFYGCPSLKNVYASNANIVSYGDNCFSYCKALETVDYPSMLTRIGSQCFRDCEKLTSGDFSGTKLETISNWGLGGCVSIKSLKVPATLKNIYGNALQNMKIEELVLPHGFLTLSNDSLPYMYELYMLILPEIAADNTGIHPEAMHSTNPKVVIYSGNEYEHLTSSGKLFASYTVKPFSEYDPSVTYTQKTFFYGATTCSKCNGLLGEESFKITSIVDEMKLSTLCTHCGGEDIKESFAPVFVDLGYSTFTANGQCSIVHGFKIDYDSFDKYNLELPENQISAFGVLAVADSKVGDVAFDDEGNALDGVIHYQMKQEHNYFEIKIIGIPSEGNATSGEAYTDIKFHMCAYVEVGGEIYYISGSSAENVLGDAVSYNSEQ